MRNLILSFNPFNENPTVGQVLNHVQVNRHITQYYQPFPGTFMLKSDLGAEGLSNTMRGLFETVPFLVVEFNAQASAGAMPEGIWTWINHGLVPSVTTTPTNSNFPSWFLNAANPKKD